jgi:uncharacterized RDD family membrane protein YckC
MDNFQIETAQNITLQQNVAHLTTRVGSYLIDFLIILGYSITVYVIMSKLNIPPSMENMAVYLLLSLPVMFYHLTFEVLLNGQSPGKLANRIRVVKLDGSKPTLGSYFLRWFLRFIDISTASGSVAVLTILLNGKGQRLGDIAGGTTVISEKKRITLKDTLVTDIPADYIPTFPQVTVLSDSDIQTIKNVYKNALRKRKHNIILKLHIKVQGLLNVKTDLKPVDFINKVIADYNYYTQQ